MRLNFPELIVKLSRSDCFVHVSPIAIFTGKMADNSRLTQFKNKGKEADSLKKNRVDEVSLVFHF